VKFVQARHYRKGRTKPLRLVVWHDMEAPEKSTTAESVAHYFATTDREASAHLCADTDSVVECVKPGDTAFHAPGANADGYGVELAGYARQTKAEWADAGSKATIRTAAKAVAPVMKAHGIPARWLTDAQVADGKTKGMTTHAQVTKVLKKSTHTDPGPNFPKSFVLQEVQHALGTPIAPKPAPAPKPRPTIRRGMGTLAHPDENVRYGQQRLTAHRIPTKADGVFGPGTEANVKTFQRRHGLNPIDGIVGRGTWPHLERKP
jgi:peptidoglycan hydrolase-like protein with peptidoglycan-binding domain